MFNFIFQNPVKLIFGKGQIACLDQEIPKNKRILMTYGGGSIKKNGVYQQVRQALKGHVLHEFNGIEPNPHFETLMEAVAIVHKEKIDFLLAVGGGSVIDGTKFIAAAAVYPGDPWTILTEKPKLKDAIPIGTVLTLPATGSEMNDGAVITKAAIKQKTFFIDPTVYPKFSILDPTTTYSLPWHQTANGIIDTYVHVLEQYLTYPVDAPLQDRFSESILITLIEEAARVAKDPQNYAGRANIMLCAAIALNGLLACGVPTDWAAHNIGHEITALFGLDHGQTLAIICPSVMQVKRDQKGDKIIQYGERIFGIKKGSRKERIDKTIQKTRTFFESMGVSTKLKDYGIAKKDIKTILSQLKLHDLTALGEHGDISLQTSKLILEDAF